MKKKKIQYASMTRGEKILGTVWLVIQVFLADLMGLLNGLLTDPMSIGTLSFAACLVNFLVTVCIFRKFLLNSLSSAWHSLWQFAQAVILGFVFCWASIRLLDWLLSFVIGSYSPMIDTSISDLMQSGTALRLIGILLLVPVVEETLYRGLVFRSLWRKSKALGYIISVLVFAAVHTLGYLGTPDITALALCFVRYLPAGLILAWTCSKADNVFASILVHAAINAVTIGIF